MLPAPSNLRILKDNEGDYILLWKTVRGADYYNVYGKVLEDSMETIAFIGSTPQSRFRLPCYALHDTDHYLFFVMPVNAKGMGATSIIIVEWELKEVFHGEGTG